MNAAALDLLAAVGGYATTQQLLTVMTRQQLNVQVRNGGLVRIWYGVYAATEPDMLGRLAALDVFMGKKAVACLGTAAALYGFDLENTSALHILDPGVRMRPTVGLMVHQRTGAPLRRVSDRLATAPAWTASKWRGNSRARGRWQRWTLHCTRRCAHHRSWRARCGNNPVDAESSQCGPCSTSSTAARNPPWRANRGW